MQPQPEINAPLSAKAGGGDGLANRNGTRLNNAHQSIIADKVNNEKDINFVSNVSSGSQGAAAGVAHSISANNLNVQGAVNIETNVHYGSQESNIRKWLSSQVPFEFGTKQSENLRTSREAPSTGNWLLKSERFLQWRDGDVRSLWCYGIPGAGKTILAFVAFRSTARILPIR
ncbi:hypothetical protein B0T22DRAFT_173090 [Podospora appendiculata]|uniref:Nephrocystin 3-like N-terminal domain-containing protein n=1 Tax=Podospora appendiculata TaxID=314037 RepID=A0AAE0XBF1_9PEZI|nr:hypothetical protein B0T22DRAFT_173090 [Podospora appendiculata]